VCVQCAQNLCVCMFYGVLAMTMTACWDGSWEVYVCVCVCVCVFAVCPKFVSVCFMVCLQ